MLVYVTRKVLEKGGPYPQVILPQFGGYWIEDVEAPAGTPSSSESSFCEEEDGGEGMSPGGGHSYRLECNSTARAYRKHFLGKVSAVMSVCTKQCESLKSKLHLSPSLTSFSISIHPGAHELLLHRQQHRQPHHVPETRRGWWTGVPAHHAQVQSGKGSNSSFPSHIISSGFKVWCGFPSCSC